MGSDAKLLRHMHASSFEKMRSIRDAYVPHGSAVLDIGSASVRGGNYGHLFRAPDYSYVGADIEAAPNVTIVLDDAYNWHQIADDSFDAVISGQTFEHNPYFWITTAEMARVVKPGGIIALIAPSSGRVHRYPLDCWRFYPDSWPSLARYVGLELLESYVERDDRNKVVDGIQWHDAAMIARKPTFANEQAEAQFAERLALIRSTAPAFPEVAEPYLLGPALEDYERRHALTSSQATIQRAKLRLQTVRGKARRAYRRLKP